MKIESGPALRAARTTIRLSQSKLSELTGISQHILSALELGKTPLNDGLRADLEAALNNVRSVISIVSRRKRYREHDYVRVPLDAERAARCTRTKGNEEYISLLRELHSHDKEPRLTAISLFSGIGGMSLGFRWAGFEIKGFLEINESLRRIYRTNFKRPAELGGDISSITDSEITAQARLIGPVDAVIGGPPCQGFSLSGKRSIDDPRNTLFLDYLRYVEVMKPKIAVMENVRLLTSMKSRNGSLVRDEIFNEFRKRQYNVQMYEVNAKDYGVPQHRERVFFVAVRADIDARPTFPSPQFSRQSSDLFSSPRPHRTFADACSDLPFLESGQKSPDPLHFAVSHPRHVVEWLWDVAEGFSAHDNVDAAMRPPSGYNTTYKRQVWLEPGATVQTTFGMISGCRNVHPIATRSLTVREAARLQSFPDSFEFPGALGAVRTGLGNAVPPLLAYEIAEHLSNTLLAKY